MPTCCVLERGAFSFDEAAIQDRPECARSPYHGRAMQARVAATWLRGACIWDGTTVLARPGTGRFVQAGSADAPLYLAIAGHEAVGKPIGGREPAAPQGE